VSLVRLYAARLLIRMAQLHRIVGLYVGLLVISIR